MRTKHRKTLESIFKQPMQSSIRWTDIESLFESLGAKVSEGRGSRVRVILHGVKFSCHKPHPQKEINKGALISIRRFLENAGVRPC